MGYSWEHPILLEKRLPLDPNLKHPACLGGARACPPEDCGCIYGFYDLLKANRDSGNRRHCNPDAFPVDNVNQRLHGGRRRTP